MTASELLSRLDVIIEKIDSLIALKREGTELLDLLELPDHLRKTFIALIKVGGQGTAEEVAAVTGRARAVESGYLNQLVLMRYVTKKRDGRKAVFTKVKR